MQRGQRSSVMQITRSLMGSYRLENREASRYEQDDRLADRSGSKRFQNSMTGESKELHSESK